MLGKGKRTKEWEAVRRQLKRDFEKRGITRCEVRFYGCWNDNALGFAHLDKRRYLTKDGLKEVVLACNPCHDILEKWPREKMRAYLQNLINHR